MRPKRCTISADPPVRSLTLEQSGTIRLHLKETGNDANRLTASSSRVEPSLLKARNKVFTLTSSDIISLIAGFANLKFTHGLEFALRKVCVWGPLNTLASDEVYPRLGVDLGSTSAGLVITDRHTPTHRARLGISIPYTIWLAAGSETIVHFVLGSDDLSRICVMDLSVTWRIGEGL